MSKRSRLRDATPRGMVLAVLAAVTLGVAILSVAVSYDILEPKFGAWAVPTVVALDALWVVFQATEILAHNNRARAARVQRAGLALTAINAAIPTVDLVLNRTDGFDLAVVITPIAIVATKCAWWLTLPSLGRRTSADTRRTLDDQRQDVADQLERMEADAAHRIELLAVATDLERRVAEAETAYRRSVLEIQQTMTEELHRQAEATAATVEAKPLSASVAAIALPELGQWTPTAPALPGTGRHTPGTQVSALPGGPGTPAGTDGGTPSRPVARAVTLADLAAVAGVPVPQPDTPLTDRQMDVVLRHLRYSDDPPRSYRKARDDFRRAGYVGSEERVRHAWGALLAAEEESGQSEDSDSEDEPADAGA
ncbi:hypothetical protein ABZ508_34395 [Streptomyces lavendulocolor]|uniref:DUF2637 domain-containing protein n=1 Tax=Streptomyces lavendulocolor TaxID=67316 RepID=A0ABV2WGI5_9ACTN